MRCRHQLATAVILLSDPRVAGRNEEIREMPDAPEQQARAKIDDRWKRKYQETALPDTANLPELPEWWTWASLDMIADATGVEAAGTYHRRRACGGAGQGVMRAAYTPAQA